MRQNWLLKYMGRGYNRLLQLQLLLDLFYILKAIEQMRQNWLLEVIDRGYNVLKEIGRGCNRERFSATVKVNPVRWTNLSMFKHTAKY